MPRSESSELLQAAAEKARAELAAESPEDRAARIAQARRGQYPFTAGNGLSARHVPSGFETSRRKH